MCGLAADVKAAELQRPHAMPQVLPCSLKK